MSDFEQWFAKECPTYRDGPFTGEIKSQLRNAFEAGQAAKQSMQGEAVAEIVYDRKTDENGNTYHKSRPQVWPLISSDELLAYPHSTRLYTHAPDSAARIAEQSAEIARLTKELEEARNLQSLPTESMINAMFNAKITNVYPLGKLLQMLCMSDENIKSLLCVAYKSAIRQIGGGK